MRWRIEWGLFGLLACSEGVQQLEPVVCDPVADEGCAAGTHCRVVEGGVLACLAMTDPGMTCRPGSCAPGETCAVIEGRMACRSVCALDAPACATGTCAYGLGDSAWGICAPPCRLGDCPPGSTCAPIVAAAHPICVATGPGGLGAPCSDVRCGQGLGCLLRDSEPRCLALCDPEGDNCEGGACSGVIRETPELGFCD